MTSDRWEHIFTIFDAALARPEPERAAFLSDQCGEDARLREEVESLLAAHGDADGFLSGRPAPAGASGTAVDRSGPAPPSLTRGLRLGVFDIESFVGAGGMGEVYRARDTRLDRHVAIKVLSPDGASDPRGRARFAYEARAIARLSHPRICSLHEMGHQEGVDFLVMAEQGPFALFSAFVYAYGTGTLQLPRELLLFAVLTASAGSFVFIPLFGHLSDVLGRKRVYLAGAVLTGIYGFVYFWLLDTRLPAIVFTAIALSLIPHDMSVRVESSVRRPSRNSA